MCHAIGTENFHPYIRLACEMLLNRDVYDTSVPQCIINDDRVVSSPVDAVIADVMGAVATLHGVTASAAFSITIQSYIPPSGVVGLGD